MTIDELGLVLGVALIGLVACATSAKESTDAAEPATAASGSSTLRPSGFCPAENPSATGTSERSIESSGVNRRFLLHVPSRAPSVAPWPLVIELHGSGGTPEGQMSLSQLEALSEQRGFLLLAAEAVDQRWNVPPDASRASDVRLFGDVLDALIGEGCVDASRVYATGLSGGGRLVSQLACALAPRVAAIAAVGGIRFPEPCASSRAVPILAFHGTADDVNPYAGGGPPYWGTGVDAAIAGWAQHNACPTVSEETLGVSPTTVTRVRHSGEACVDVEFYRIEGFAHTWPSDISFASNVATGGEPLSPSANDLIWAFFGQHPLPGP